MGKAGFAHLLQNGERLQIYVRKDAVARERLRSLPAPRHRRHHRSRGLPVPDQDGRAERPRREADPSGEDAPLHAREMARPGGRRDPLPPALPGSDRQSRSAEGLCGARQTHRLVPPPARRARLHRSGNAHDAAALRRRGGPSLHHPPQHARHGSLPAHRAGALPQAPGRRGHGARLRDQPEFPQRGRLDTAQPRVHHARVLPGLHGLPRA